MLGLSLQHVRRMYHQSDIEILSREGIRHAPPHTRLGWVHATYCALLHGLQQARRMRVESMS